MGGLDTAGATWPVNATSNRNPVVDSMSTYGVDSARLFQKSIVSRLQDDSPPREQVKILQDAMVKAFNDPAFHKDYKKYTGDEAFPLMPDEMEKLVKEMPRDAEIVELFKKLNAAGPLPAR